jgi:hypothetical protein
MKVGETIPQKRDKQKIVNYKSLDDALKIKRETARQAITGVLLPENWTTKKS